MSDQKDNSLDPAELPEKDVFNRKEVFQHKQPADTGKPLEDETGKAAVHDQLKDAEKTSREEGLNEEQANGDVAPVGE